jgi:hypothetical protein
MNGRLWQWVRDDAHDPVAGEELRRQRAAEILRGAGRRPREFVGALLERRHFYDHEEPEVGQHDEQRRPEHPRPPDLKHSRHRLRRR